MSIESLASSEGQNIHDFSVEIPEANSYISFDLKRDIPPEVIEKMREFFKDYRKRNESLLVTYGVRQYYILKIIDKTFETSNPHVSLLLNDSFTKVQNFEYAAAVSLIEKGIKSQIAPEFWDHYTNEYYNYQNNNLVTHENINHYLEGAEFKMIDNEIDLRLTEKDWHNMNDILDSFDLNTVFGLSLFPKMAAAVRILFPERKLNISKETWQKLKTYLDSIKLATSYADMAINMYIMSSGVEFVDGQMIIKDPVIENDFKDAELKLPEVREF